MGAGWCDGRRRGTDGGSRLAEDVEYSDGEGETEVLDDIVGVRCDRQGPGLQVDGHVLDMEAEVPVAVWYRRDVLRGTSAAQREELDAEESRVAWDAGSTTHGSSVRTAGDSWLMDNIDC